MRHSSIRDGILDSCNVVQALGTPVSSCGGSMTSLAISCLSSESRWRLTHGDSEFKGSLTYTENPKVNGGKQ